MKLKIAGALYLINALILFGFGIRYFFATKLMAYHAETIGIAQDGLSEKYFLVFQALYRATGAGMFVTGLTILILLAVPFRAGRPWSRWALTTIGVVFSSLSAFLTLSIQAETTANIPWPGPVAGLLTILIAHFLAAGLGKKSDA